MRLIQKEITLAPKSRGLHLIADEVRSALPELAGMQDGLAFLFLRHTSASLTLNENSDPDVRRDLEFLAGRLFPEDPAAYRHTLEGPDDLPAHAKSSFVGAGLWLPVKQGRFHLGTWQGLYLWEHRNHGGPRRLSVTLLG